MNQLEKAIAFRALHERDHAFIIPNPWDIGTARLLAGLGFEALATTSAGYAFSLGQRDNTIGREQMMDHVRAIVSATDLPVSADLENGFGDHPRTVAERFSSRGPRNGRTGNVRFRGRSGQLPGDQRAVRGVIGERARRSSGGGGAAAGEDAGGPGAGWARARLWTVVGSVVKQAQQLYSF